MRGGVSPAAGRGESGCGYGRVRVRVSPGAGTAESGCEWVRVRQVRLRACAVYGFRWRHLGRGHTRRPIDGDLEHRGARMSPPPAPCDTDTHQPDLGNVQHGHARARIRCPAPRARTHQPAPRRLGARVGKSGGLRHFEAQAGNVHPPPATRSAGRLCPPVSADSKRRSAISSRRRRLPTQAADTQPVRRLRTRPLQGRPGVWGRSPQKLTPSPPALTLSPPTRPASGRRGAGSTPPRTERAAPRPG